MFENKTVIITGACGGIGLSLCEKFQNLGANLVLTDINEESLNELVAKINNNNNVVGVAGNIAEKSVCEKIIDTAVKTFNRIDILVNNAGVIPRGSIEETTDEMWDLAMGVNVTALFYLCRGAFPHLKKNEGANIINTSSMWGLYPGPNHIAYITAKGAVAVFTKSLARDFAPHGIRVNAVAPNEVNTPMLRSGFEKRGFDAENGIKELNKTVPLGRIAEPEDIADLTIFLASDNARYVTGEVIELSGCKPVSG
ncbi:MAG: SDR family NAD(P)-dependent oxidoreductase [Alphaproteobacteria bacterium]